MADKVFNEIKSIKNKDRYRMQYDNIKINTENKSDEISSPPNFHFKNENSFNNQKK